MTDFVIDTVALIRYLEDSLPPAADEAFRSAERRKNTLFLPEIAFGEFVYTALRGRLNSPVPRELISEVLDHIEVASYLVLSQLTHRAWNVFLQLNMPELHDRMIAADAICRDLTLISNDPSFSGIPFLKTLWK